MFTHFLAELISIEIMFCGIGILELNGTIILYGIAVAIILCLFAETGFSLNYLLTVLISKNTKDMDSNRFSFFRQHFFGRNMCHLILNPT